MRKRFKRLQITIIPLLLFSLLFLPTTWVQAKALETIDVSSSEYQWEPGEEEGSYQTTVTLHVGDTFQKIWDSTLESDPENQPEIQQDFGDIITKNSDGLYVVTAAGTATITYTSTKEADWHTKTIHIITKELEATHLTTSFKKGTIKSNTSLTLKVNVTAQKNYDQLQITNKNNNIISVQELTSKRVRNKKGVTTYYYKIIPLSKGTATLKISSKTNPALTATITITVKQSAFKATNYVTNPTGKYTYSAMVTDLKQLTKYHKDTKPIALTTIGKTLDKRNLYSLRIGDPNAKKRVLVTTGIHGREYMNPYFVMENLEYMLNHYNTYNKKKGFSYRQLYDKVCLYIIPMCNPDGISIAQSGPNAIRNKTLRANIKKIKKSLRISYSRWKGNARNVDLNRNFPIGWEKKTKKRKEGTSGSKAASEPETKSIMKHVNKIKPTAVLNYHSRGEIIYWGYAIKKTSNCYKQAEAMKNIVQKLTGYRPIPPHKSTKDACGCLEDWLAYTKKIPNLCIETGNVDCPLPMSQYKRINQKNQYVIEEICKHFR